MTVLIPATTSGSAVALASQSTIDQAQAIVHVPAAMINNVATPVSTAAPLPVYNPGSAVTADSGQITIGGSSQSMFGGVVPTTGYQVSNLNATGGRTLFINDAGAASAGGTSVPILPQTTYKTPSGYHPPGPVTIFGVTAGDLYSGRRW